MAARPNMTPRKLGGDRIGGAVHDPFVARIAVVVVLLFELSLLG